MNPAGKNSIATVPAVLAIAGSDSGGGAGIQADLKAFARCGVHGTTAITAITAQNTVAVSGVTAVPPEAIIAQVEAVTSDIRVDAVKIGMLGSIETIEAVERALDLVGEAPVVLDPVMVAESGARLLDPGATEALIALLRRATFVTPNTVEARALVEAAGGDPGGDPERLAAAIGELGPRYVVVTGGHAAGDLVIDTFWDGERAVEISRAPVTPAARLTDPAAPIRRCWRPQLALGLAPLEAARQASRIAAARPSATASKRSAPGPARSTCSAWAANAAKRSGPPPPGIMRP